MNPSGFTAQSAPVLADAWTSVRRGMVMSVVSEWEAADLAEKAQIERVLNHSMNSPGTIPKPIKEALEDDNKSVLDALREAGAEVGEWLSAPTSVAAVPVKKRRNRGIGFQ